MPSAIVLWAPVEAAALDPTAPTDPYITHTGFMEIPGMEVVSCYKLNTSQTIFDLKTVERLFGGNSSGG